MALTKIYNRLSITIIQITLFALCNQCQEPYELKDLDTSLQIPVFNAMLTNVPQLNKFSLSYATPYGSNLTTGISGASIVIFEDNLPFITLIESSGGNYTMPDQLPDLKFNHRYMAQITMPTGEILKSESMLLPDTVTISEYYYTKGNNTTIIQTTTGEYVESTVYQISVYAQIKKPTQHTYTKSYSNLFINHLPPQDVIKKTTSYIQKIETSHKIISDTIFGEIKGLGNTFFPNMKEFSTSINYTAEDLSLNTINFTVDPYAMDFSLYTDYNFIEWIIPIDIYTHESTIYNYYMEAKEQLEKDFQIYDPIATQTVGNLYNETNPKNVVLGLFEVSAVNRKYMSIYQSCGLGGCEYKNRLLNDTIIRAGKYIYSINKNASN